jgi:hypothetical protein
MAVVTIAGADDGNDDGWVTITYSQSDTSAGKRPRAFGLNIVASAGEICEVNMVGCEPFDVYMGTIVIAGGQVVNPGTPVAPPGAPDALGGLGTGAITVEMGALYVGTPNAPAFAGNLIKVKCNETCTLTISANNTRATGGVVLEDSTTPGATMNPISVNVVYGGPDYLEWHNVGDPPSWGNLRQCHGDADNAQDDLGWGQYAWAGPGDVTLMGLAYRALLGSPNENLACDFDHEAFDMGWGQFTRCGPGDITVMAAYYRMVTGGPGEPPPDCQDCTPVSP